MSEDVTLDGETTYTFEYVLVSDSAGTTPTPGFTIT